mgnify:CR=1 FL=1|jgi:hypothetical protein
MSLNRKTTLQYAVELLDSTESAIENLIEEIRKPVDKEVSGSARKAELQSIKQTAVDAKEMLQIRQQLEEMIKNLSEGGEIEDEIDFNAGFAERFSKR